MKHIRKNVGFSFRVQRSRKTLDFLGRDEYRSTHCCHVSGIPDIDRRRFYSLGNKNDDADDDGDVVGSAEFFVICARDVLIGSPSIWDRLFSSCKLTRNISWNHRLAEATSFSKLVPAWNEQVHTRRGQKKEIVAESFPLQRDFCFEILLDN